MKKLLSVNSRLHSPVLGRLHPVVREKNASSSLLHLRKPQTHLLTWGWATAISRTSDVYREQAAGKSTPINASQASKTNQAKQDSMDT